MDQLEPNVAALVWFTIAWIVCCLSGLLLAGMFPLSARPAATRSPAGTGLIVANSAAFAALFAATLFYGVAELRWTTLVVVGGLVLLFSPGLFQAAPEDWRDSRRGLTIMLALTLAALAALIVLGGLGGPGQAGG